MKGLLYTLAVGVIGVMIWLWLARKPVTSPPTAQDFEGLWRGSTATLNISGSQVVATELPIFDFEDSRKVHRVVYGTGTVEFSKAYGPDGRPAVLLTFPEANTTINVYISRDKRQLEYVLDPDLPPILFSRKN
jgi:hypothetical protein